MSNLFEVIGNRRIYLNEMYFLTYAGGHRDLEKKKKDEWMRSLSLPDLAQKKEQLRLEKIYGKEINPNVVPLKGVDLLMFIRELKFVPFFDQYFEHTKMIKLTEAVIFESIKAKSYDIALKSK